MSAAWMKLRWTVVPGSFLPLLLSVCPPLPHRQFQWRRWNTSEEDTEKLTEGTKCFHNETDIPSSLLLTCNPISHEWTVLNITIRSLLLQTTSVIFQRGPKQGTGYIAVMNIHCIAITAPLKYCKSFGKRKSNHI